MGRPAGGADGFRRPGTSLGAPLAGALLTCGLVLIMLAPANAGSSQPVRALSAQSSSDAETGSLGERSLGADAGAVNRPAQRRAGNFGAEQRAEELYLDGMEKLEAGHREWASRTFEDVIARYPDTSAASLALRRLRELREAGAVTPAALPVVPPEASRTLPAADQTPHFTRTQVWDEELRRNAPIQTKLRDVAGDRVFFAPGSAELGSRARTALAAQARWLKTWHEFEAAIEGHADEPGSDEENLKLSARRAEAVRQRLVEEGVDAGRLAVVASGRNEPIATCESMACHAQNRRVVTLVFTTGTRERLGLAAPVEPAVHQAPLPAPAVVQPVDATH